MEQLLPEAPTGWAYDGDKILYTARRLGAGPIELRRGDDDGGGAEEARPLVELGPWPPRSHMASAPVAAPKALGRAPRPRHARASARARAV